MLGRTVSLKSFEDNDTAYMAMDFIDGPDLLDLVDTGNTLKANGLVELEHICDISSRLIVNKAAMKTKHARVSEIIGALRDVVEGGR